MFSKKQSVGEIVKVEPTTSHFFEEKKIDYCCHGETSFEQACRQAGIDVETALHQLENLVKNHDKKAEADIQNMTLTQLADHIEATHHRFLYDQLPAIENLAKKVAQVHGSKDHRLAKILETFSSLKQELMSHLQKEEQILFPMIRELEKSETMPQFHCGSVSNPVRQMIAEHEDAGEALDKLRSFTDDYQVPEWGCASTKELYRRLQELEYDLHRHIHKENTVLFPAAVDLEDHRKQK